MSNRSFDVQICNWKRSSLERRCVCIKVSVVCKDKMDEITWGLSVARTEVWVLRTEATCHLKVGERRKNQQRRLRRSSWWDAMKKERMQDQASSERVFSKANYESNTQAENWQSDLATWKIIGLSVLFDSDGLRPDWARLSNQDSRITKVDTASGDKHLWNIFNVSGPESTKRNRMWSPPSRNCLEFRKVGFILFIFKIR